MKLNQMRIDETIHFLVNTILENLSMFDNFLIFLISNDMIINSRYSIFAMITRILKISINIFEQWKK